MIAADRYSAIVQRDPTQDGLWFYGVTTTGVFCQPSCSARTPKAENVRYYGSAEEAIQDTMRPCLKCRPSAEIRKNPQLAVMKKLCRFIQENADEGLTLEVLSEKVGYSPSHFQRVFKELIGVSPRVYVEACRIQKLRGLLKVRPVGDAILGAGFGSPSRVYEKVDDRLGMTPDQFRKGGNGVEISFTYEESVLGPLLLAATDRGVCFVQFGNSQDELTNRLQAEFPKAMPSPSPDRGSTQLSLWMDALKRHLAGDIQTFRDLPLDIAGTAFQAKVWRFLQSVPAGEVRSYTELALAIGQPAAVRAAASACAANRIAVLIPCHRVIRGDGGLGGYRWGLDRKSALLEVERSETSLIPPGS